MSLRYHRLPLVHEPHETLEVAARRTEVDRWGLVSGRSDLDEECCREEALYAVVPSTRVQRYLRTGTRGLPETGTEDSPGTLTLQDVVQRYPQVRQVRRYREVL